MATDLKLESDPNMDLVRCGTDADAAVQVLRSEPVKWAGPRGEQLSVYSIQCTLYIQCILYVQCTLYNQYTLYIQCILYIQCTL